MSGGYTWSTYNGVRRLSPCPFCGATQRGSKDKRPPFVLRLDGEGGKCHSCGEGCYRKRLEVLLGNAMPPRAEEQPPRQLKYPQLNEIEAVLNCCGAAPTQEMIRLFKIDSSRLPPAALYWMREQPPVYWWCRSWGLKYRALALCYDHNGELKTVHARATEPDVEPKTRFPWDHDSVGTLLLAGVSLDIVQRRNRDAHRVIVCEGLTDWWACLAAYPTLPVVGVYSGSTDAVGLVRWPPGTSFLILTDQDKTGDTYAAKITRAVHPLECRRLTVERGDRGKE